MISKFRIFFLFHVLHLREQERCTLPDYLSSFTKLSARAMTIHTFDRPWWCLTPDTTHAMPHLRIVHAPAVFLPLELLSFRRSGITAKCIWADKARNQQLGSPLTFGMNKSIPCPERIVLPTRDSKNDVVGWFEFSTSVARTLVPRGSLGKWSRIWRGLTIKAKRHEERKSLLGIVLVRVWASWPPLWAVWYSDLEGAGKKNENTQPRRSGE